ncbi:TonB-dependent receptor [Variovorax arabinosiphilus]|uniref:TonB-dependent receptor n=1 Tax=Variovorax arabinosiphilus TaxID=3053498 RepID=UPI002575690F|nr:MULTISPECIES: TonB-dependent siderophore receptor [unclassified Variovorax]MDM0120619.1 TonB-dependent siderophore receptor [Variovorax sp. J2L1-78]MDM0127469.1 TonB-dependent siderophore receptor [Variovorax sp. J2L1-63]MDM0231168.1 TonB-dependent siderophore receptor [Variovorax sp. J2R1-6]
MNSSPACSSQPHPRFAPKPLAQRMRQCLGASLALLAAGATAQTTTSTTLQEVVVSDQTEAIGGLQKTYSGGQFARGGSLGILGITDLMNVPFSTTNYTSELIENQQALTIADVVMNDASVRTLAARGGYGDDFQVRGFTVNSRDVGMNGLVGLAPATRIPLEMIERVEVLKGPGSFTSGTGPNNSIGGSINVVTKRAADVPLTRLTTTYMGKAQFGTHLDVGRRFGEDNQWGVRANGVWRNGEGNVDGGRQRLGLGSLGVDYAGSRLRWSLDALTTSGKTTEFRPQIAFRSGITQAPAVPDNRSSFYPGADMTDKAKTVMSRLEFDVNDNTTVFAGVGYSDVSTDQNFPTAVTRPVDLRPNTQGNFSVNNGYYDEYNKTTSAEVGVRTRFKTGSIGHSVVLAANTLQRETGYFYQLTTTPVASNLYNPSALPAINFARGEPSKTGDLAMHSIAVADTMSFFNDRFLVTLGLRDQTINQKSVNGSTAYDASAITPLVGLVFKPVQNISVYGNYTAGLMAGGIAGATAANRGEIFAPQKSKQYEVGVKADWGTLTTQAALYQITRPNSMTDPVTQVYSFGGEQRNRGLELTMYGELQRGLRAMASASFNDAKLTRTAGGVNQGNDANGVPDRTFNVGLDWDMPWVPGLSLNGRVINTSSTYYDAANLLRMPSWTRVDLGARYATKIAGKPVVLRANLENVADKAYWVTSTYVTVGAPRTLMLSAQIDF